MTSSSDNPGHGPVEHYFGKAFDSRKEMGGAKFSADMCKMLRAQRNGYEEIGANWLIKGPIDEECETLSSSYNEAKARVMLIAMEKCQEKFQADSKGELDDNCLGFLQEIHYREYRFTESNQHIEEVGLVNTKSSFSAENVNGFRPFIKSVIKYYLPGNPIGGLISGGVDCCAGAPGLASAMVRFTYNALTGSLASIGGYFRRTGESSEK